MRMIKSGFHIESFLIIIKCEFIPNTRSLHEDRPRNQHRASADLFLLAVTSES